MTSDKSLMGSTTQVTGSRFPAHGRVDMWMQDNTLHYEASGPFNAEVFDLLAVAQIGFLKTLDLAKPWASICTIRHSAMSTPGGIQRYTELMQSPKPPQFNPVATAFVIGPGIEGGKIMIPHFARIYASIGRPFQTFETLAQAQAWTRAKVAAAGPLPGPPPVPHAF